MRVSANSVSSTLVQSLQQLHSQQSRLQGQVSSGQTISKPEDNPAVVGRVLVMESRQREISQYTSNANTALSVAKASFSGLAGLTKISDRAGELATLGTGPLGANAAKGYADETNQLIEEAVQLGNSKLNGNFIYGGTAVGSSPFVVTRTGGSITSAVYAGNNLQASIALSKRSSVQPTTDGATNTSLGAFINNLIALRDALTANNVAAVTPVGTNLRSSEDALVSAIATNGGVQSRIEATKTGNTAEDTSLQTQISNETSADLPATLVKFNQTQSTYQAALQSAAKIMKSSILDYVK